MFCIIQNLNVHSWMIFCPDGIIPNSGLTGLCNKHIYIYIYIYRERERERQIDRQSQREKGRETQHHIHTYIHTYKIWFLHIYGGSKKIIINDIYGMVNLPGNSFFYYGTPSNYKYIYIYIVGRKKRQTVIFLFRTRLFR